jgi:hypothetical protein
MFQIDLRVCGRIDEDHGSSGNGDIIRVWNVKDATIVHAKEEWHEGLASYCCANRFGVHSNLRCIEFL